MSVLLYRLIWSALKSCRIVILAIFFTFVRSTSGELKLFGHWMTVKVCVFSSNVVKKVFDSDFSVPRSIVETWWFSVYSGEGRGVPFLTNFSN